MTMTHVYSFKRHEFKVNGAIVYKLTDEINGKVWTLGYYTKEELKRIGVVK